MLSHQVRGIVKAARRLHGREKGLDFAVALTDALNSYEAQHRLTAPGRA